MSAPLGQGQDGPRQRASSVSLREGRRSLGYDTLRVARALSSLSLRSIRSVAQCRAILQSLAASILDLEFETKSPFPLLQLERLRPWSDDFVALPPVHLIEPGNQSQLGLLQLVTVARALSAKRIFEIGTYNGLTALTLATNLPDATIETLDLPTGTQPDLRLWTYDAENLSNFAIRQYESSSAASRIVQHLGDSAAFDFGSFRESFDLVYVDGAHSWEYVENDTSVAFTIVKPTGAIIWDDYWRRIPSVPAFLHSVDDRSLFRLPGTRLVVWFGPAALDEMTLRERIRVRPNLCVT